jgi:hypothetical protein
VAEEAGGNHLLIPVASRSVAYRRCFIDAAYLRHPDALAWLNRTPIRGLSVGNVRTLAAMRALAEADVLHRLHTLDVGMTAGDVGEARHFAGGEVMRILAQSKVQNITRLRLRESAGGGSFDGASARPLFEGRSNFSCLKALEMTGWLDVYDEGLVGAFLSHIARSPLARQLERLVLPAPCQSRIRFAAAGQRGAKAEEPAAHADSRNG